MSVFQDWATKLDNPTISTLPHDYLRPQHEPLIQQESYSVQLPQLQVPHGKDSYITALAVWAIIVYRLTGDDDIVLLIKDNKVIRFTIQPTWTFAELYKSVSTELESVSTLTKVNFDELSNYVKETNDLETFPQYFRLAFVNEQDISLSQYKHSLLDTALSLSEDGQLHIIYNALLYSQDRISILADQFTQFISQVLKDDSLQITKVSMITASSKTALPDPTNNLGWCDFRGCIHDIFQDNAEKFPKRTCVVETRCV